VTRLEEAIVNSVTPQRALCLFLAAVYLRLPVPLESFHWEDRDRRRVAQAGGAADVDRLVVKKHGNNPIGIDIDLLPDLADELPANVLLGAARVVQAREHLA